MTNYIYDAYGRTEPSRIYLARPGKRMLGCLNGTKEDTCSLTLNFVNANEISFDVYKYHNEELTNYYDYIDILMELYVDGFGWFFIDESPTVHNDGLTEYKSVLAKSYEYTLHQYDLVGFDINTASPTSREMLATDNVYTYSTSSEIWYNLFRDRVLFYRPTTEHKALVEEMNEITTYQELQQLLAGYPNVVYQDWRITIPIDSQLRAGFVQMKEIAEDAGKSGEVQLWQNWIDSYDSSTGVTSDAIKTLLLSYPELVKYIGLEFNKKKYVEDFDTGKYVETDEEYTAYQLMKMEYKRIKELSLLDLVISDVPGWEVGEVDGNLYPEHTDINGAPILLRNEVGNFEIDSQDVYSFLVTELSGYFDCIFTFDTINNRINAYRIEGLGVDTKIFLGFRNIQNSVEITPAQELFTQFTVENSEGLSIPYVNFGQREIEDISYFLNTKYLPQELIDKYKSWKEFCEEKRPEYIQLSLDYNKQYEKTQEIKTRVPSDMLNISQLDNYSSQDQLEEVIDNYYALMVGILTRFIYVSTQGTTPPKDRDLYDDYDDYIADWNIYIGQLEDLVDVNKEESATAFVDSLYHDSYKMMHDFTVPNLKIAYDNLDLYNYETKTEYYDAYEYQFDEATYGDQAYGYMYGLDELKVYQKTHADKMETYSEYSLAWDDIPEDDPEAAAFKAKYVEADYTSKHNLYEKYKAGYESATREIAIRQAEYDAEMQTLEDIDTRRKEIADAVKMENFSIAKISTVFHEVPNGWLYDELDYYLTQEQDGNFFTENEIDQISRFFRHTDYSNDNINYLSKIDSTDDVIDKQLEMYQYAVDELYAESHPQYTYSTSVDDLLANNEYELYHPDFEVGNFVRLGLDDETQVQLRMITIQFNPMIYDNNLQITFSNMVQYRNKRNDFQSLLSSAITSAKNSIQARYSRTADSDNTVQVTYDLVQKILQSGPFTAASQNIQAGSVSAATGTFQTLSTGFLKTDELAAEVAKIQELSADSAFIKYLEANLVVASEIKVDDLKAKLAQVDTITAGSAFVNYLQSLSSTTAQSVITDAYIKNAVMRAVSVGDLVAGNIVLTNQMKIISQNENGGNVLFNGTTLQFTDDEGNVGIQIGYGNTSTPSMIIKDENGQSMFTSTGITSAGIPDGIIVDDMIDDGTISKDKLGFPIVDTDENGNISIAHILDGSGGSFGADYTTFKNATQSSIQNIENTKKYEIIITSSNGTTFKTGTTNCTLSCTVMSWDSDITSTIDVSNFTWTRESGDATSDATWNSNHSHSKTLTITSADLRNGRGVFYCTVNLPDGTTQSSG